MVRRLLLLALAVAALTAAPAAQATTVSDSQGPVRASLSYTKRSALVYTGMRLTISRAGAQLLDQAQPRSFIPGGFGDQTSVDVVDLDSDREPEVVLTLYSGGAHCCTDARVYSYDKRSSDYRRVIHDFKDPGFRLRNLDRGDAPEFLTADAVFAYAFTSYAESRLPVQVLRFEAGKFVDVTGAFPARVRADLARHRAAYARFRRRKMNARGALAAIAADQYRLGARGAAAATVAKGRRVFGARYAQGLRRLLARAGYSK